MPAQHFSGRRRLAAWMGHGQASAFVLGAALLVYALLWVGPLQGFGLVDPLQPLWHAAVIGLGLVLMGQVLSRDTPRGLAPLKYLLGAGVCLSVAVYALGLLWGAPLAGDAVVRADSGRGVTHIAVRRGGIGSTWTDLVERRTFAYLVVRERAIAQYEREQVLRIDSSEPGRVRVHLQAPGKPDRIDDLLPG